jgi:hypothetical protein
MYTDSSILENQAGGNKADGNGLTASSPIKMKQLHGNVEPKSM